MKTSVVYAILLILAIIIIGLIIGLASLYNNPPKPEPFPVEIPIENETLDCGKGTYKQNGTCVADPIPICSNGELLNTTTLLCEEIPEPEQPKPRPIDNITRKLIAVGDVNCDLLVDPIRQKNPNLILILGDLCYDKNLNEFNSAWGSFGNVLKCLIGNHESKENAAGPDVITQAKALCKDNWYMRFGPTVIFGINTNGDLTTQQAGAIKLLTNQTFMSEFKNVVLASHKPCENLPGAHHPVESKVATFCKAFNDAVPNGTKEFYLSGHDHIIAKAVNAEGDTFFISGAGGAKHYDCGKVTGIWIFCDDANFGYLELIITPDGAVKDTFYNTRGQIVK